MAKGAPAGQQEQSVVGSADSQKGVETSGWVFGHLQNLLPTDLPVNACGGCPCSPTGPLATYGHSNIGYPGHQLKSIMCGFLDGQISFLGPSSWKADQRASKEAGEHVVLMSLGKMVLVVNT